MDFGRMLTAMVTPFDKMGRINWTQTEALIDHLIDVQQTDSLVICGSTGESPTLTDEEKLELFRFTVDKVNGRCRVIAGTGSNHTAHAIELSQAAEEIGVDGLLLVAPYYNRPTQEGIFRHFEQIAASVQIPIMIYNIPIRTGVNIEAATTIRLSQIANIVAVKESKDLSQIAEVISHAASGFKVYSGDDCMALPTLAVGGYGIVSVASHLVGKEIKAMIQAYLEGNPESAAAKHRELLPIIDALFLCPNPVPVKYALTRKGLDVGEVRLPLVPANDEEKKVLNQYFSS